MHEDDWGSAPRTHRRKMERLFEQDAQARSGLMAIAMLAAIPWIAASWVVAVRVIAG